MGRVDYTERKVICGNYRLSATEILDALGIMYNEEEED